MRQAEGRAKRNKSIKSKTKTTTKNLLQLISQGNMEEAQKKLPQAISTIDSAWSKGVWHKNKAAREKARLMKSLNQGKT